MNSPELVGAVQTGLDNSPYRGYVDYVVNRLLIGMTCYLLGGSVRDPIVNFLYGREVPTKDYDILVDNLNVELDLPRLFFGMKDVFTNSYGTVKWRPDVGIELDVTTFTNANPIRRGEDVKPSLELWLSTCDFNTSSLAYGLGDQVVYDYQAMEGIYKQEVELIGGNDPPQRVLARLVLHSDKLGFKIGRNGIRFIRSHYNPGLDERIMEHLRYHNQGEKFPMVKHRLTEIAQSS